MADQIILQPTDENIDYKLKKRHKDVQVGLQLVRSLLFSVRPYGLDA